MHHLFYYNERMKTWREIGNTDGNGSKPPKEKSAPVKENNAPVRDIKTTHQ